MTARRATGNRLTFTPLTISYGDARLQPTNPFPREAGWPLHKKTPGKAREQAPALALGGQEDGRMGRRTLLSRTQWRTEMQKHVYLAIPPQRLTVREMKRSSGAHCRALGDPRCPPNAPDAYPFHTISLCVTNSRTSANGNG